jgi:subtilisin
MRKVFFTLFLVAGLMLVGMAYNAYATGIGGEVSSGHVSDEALDNASPMAAFKRLVVTPTQSENDLKLRSILPSIHHEFDGKFTADVPFLLLNQVKTLADVEVVPIHHLNGKPVCGNGIVEGGEKCGEPGLSCDAGKVCENCKCVDEGGEDPPVGRTCEPPVQTDYNVTQVNGGSGGAGVTVAVLDTGVDTDHLDLVNRVTVCKDATKRGIRNGCEDRDGVGHGTHSAGIIAADAGSDGLGLIGVAPEADLMIIKVCGPAGCYTDDIAAAIDYAAANGADIINMSLGGPIESSLISAAIARNPNVLYVASAGNSGPGANTIEYPGANPAVMAIAANDAGIVVADFSSRGIDDGNDSSIAPREVELTAGGVAVLSTDNDGCYSPLSGTSFSSPTVAGLAAKVWQGTAELTRAYLVSIATDVTSAIGGGAEVGFDDASGYGLPVAP